ncbi:DUF4388 domain-containing protein [Pyrinomonas methylaliphatogenes]|uniref:PatA-like N-terminal domain-containing protein n=1 Tax=Pyrinomonas methylaliphatogenes TaxID=454194 RepID=A0A0B6WYI6_9BACT|nr:DUF4388 domain-containing protein [Pyrinomonas methylaliphatogenes]MBX5479417.1 DUF4388 domain-containing protein [Pyrinomonas methylaliphatogenes]CDM66333.1 Domain of unknown function (DUF4388) [Pyrinomonas methylaliphatogenes]
MMGESYKGLDSEIESALLDADLFVKYGAMQRAINRLQQAIARYPHSIELRERLREVAIMLKLPGEAARQCLMLARLYIERENFDAAHERLLEAKQHEPRISIAAGLEAIRRARRPEQSRPITASSVAVPAAVFAGDLSLISIFDVVQVLENARLTGVLKIVGGEREGRILFNDGQIVGAEHAAKQGEEAFRALIEATSGAFSFEQSADPFPVTISAASNTNLILDALRQLDEERKDAEFRREMGGDAFP